jgi:MFS family permease
MANPTLFTIIGDSLPRERRTMGFTMQSMLRRVPIGIAASVGGILIARFGIVRGVRISLLITMGLGLMTAVIASRIQIPQAKSVRLVERGDLWRMIPSPLRHLLTSDILIRVCEGMVEVLIVLYAVDIIGVSAPQYGLLVAVQMITSIAVYIPAAKLSDRLGRKPFVIATFLFFAMYPLAIVLASGMAGLVGAFIIGGLREIGEPSRKAMIVDFALPEFRGRVVGLYYLARSISIAPSAFAGGLLWNVMPAVPFFVAAAVGVVGTLVFAVTVNEQP